MKTDIEDLLKQRSETHGDWCINGGLHGELINACINTGRLELLDKHTLSAVFMILNKVSRIVAGNSKEPDHFKDIIGYAKLEINLMKLKEEE